MGFPGFYRNVNIYLRNLGFHFKLATFTKLQLCLGAAVQVSWNCVALAIQRVLWNAHSASLFHLPLKKLTDPFPFQTA